MLRRFLAAAAACAAAQAPGAAAAAELPGAAAAAAHLDGAIEACTASPACAQTVSLDPLPFQRLLRLADVDVGNFTAQALLDRVHTLRGSALPSCGAGQFVSVGPNGVAVCACNGDGAEGLFTNKDVFYSCDARSTDAITDTLLLTLTFVVVFQSMSTAMDLTAQ
jgi:hypothetical protein